MVSLASLFLGELLVPVKKYAFNLSFDVIQHSYWINSSDSVGDKSRAFTLNLLDTMSSNLSCS